MLDVSMTCVYDICFVEFILKSFKIDKKILLHSVLQKPVLRMGYQITLTQYSKQHTIFDVCEVRLKCTYAISYSHGFIHLDYIE